MKTEVYAICYNEEVMLPYFLRHYSCLCDRIVIYDNYSTDRSDEICRQNPKVELIKYDSGNQIRDDIYLEIKNNCWKKSTADWVIVCDIDELLVQLNSPVDLDNYTVVMPDWYEMVGDKLPSTPGQIYEEINHGVSQGQISKCIMFKPASVKDINYHPGAHGINAVGDVRVLHTSDFGIFHYKYLSLQYVINRHAMYRDRLSDINKRLKWGVHYNNSVQEITDMWNSLQERKTKVI